MGKSSHLTLLLLLVSAASAAARNPSAGLDAACEKTPYSDFCELLLQPSAGQFADNDPKKMGHAAINATVSKVQSMKTYLVSLGVKKTQNPELKAAVMDCVDRLGRSETSLNAAAREFNYTRDAAEANAPRKLGKADPAKMIDSATAEAKGCLEALQKSEGPEKKAAPGGGGAADVTVQAVRQANDTVLACYVAKAFVVVP